MATLLLKIGKREMQKCIFNRKEALFTPSDTAAGYLSCAVRGTILYLHGFKNINRGPAW